ncbi:MAG: PAS domain S-box protein [Cephaloticoccus sp.]|nr:PAS domain S-box protein [Cephaloticoccus sp.]
MNPAPEPVIPVRPGTGVRLRVWVWWIVASYVLLSVLWIYFSDQALELAVNDPAWRLRMSVYKGWVFVGVTAILLWIVLGRLGREIARGDEAVRRHEAEIERLTRFYAALSQVNQTIVWSSSRDELLQRVCEALIEHGRFSLAWIGWHDPASACLRPVAVCGEEDDYLKTFQVFTDARPEGQGPIARAFRAGRHYVSNDVLRDPASKPWLHELQSRRLRSAVFLPLRQAGAIVGMLCVYAHETDVFQERELALLQEAATDITFALDTLKHDEERRRAEAAVDNERRFSATMIDSMPGILYFYDTAGRFLRWNRNFELASGYTGEEIARMHPMDFFAAEDRPLLEARIAEVFEQGESSVEAPFLSKTGTATPYFFTGRRVVYEGRVCLLGVGIDITTRRQAEQALREAQSRLATVVNNLREGLIMADPAGDFLEWNPAALDMLGFSDLEEGRQRQRDFGELFALQTMDGEDVPPQAWPLARVRRGETIDRLELVVRRRGQEWTRIFSYSGGQARYADGRSLAFITLRDITLRKEAEKVLRESRDLLEKQVAERTEELQGALVRAEAADRLKSAFLATMSHELRTPLNSIIGFTGILLQHLAGPLNEEQKRQLGMVRGSAQHLLELINDVLDISKIEAGQMTVRCAPFDLREAIVDVSHSVQPLADRKQLELAPPEIGPGLDVMVGDRRRVEQVLLNLLNNAVKFTDQGRVILRAEKVGAFVPPGGSEPQPAVRLAVTDTGLGIRAEDQACLFQPFRQVDTGLTRLHEGTGLGLAICRRLVHLMGGTIEVASEWGRGSTFTVTLPLRLQAGAGSS